VTVSNLRLEYEALTQIQENIKISLTTEIHIRWVHYSLKAILEHTILFYSVTVFDRGLLYPKDFTGDIKPLPPNAETASQKI
jgi:hypothetical protein